MLLALLVLVLYAVLIGTPLVLLAAWLEWSAPAVLDAVLGAPPEADHTELDDVGARPRRRWSMLAEPAGGTAPTRLVATAGGPVVVSPVETRVPVRLVRR